MKAHYIVASIVIALSAKVCCAHEDIRDQTLPVYDSAFTWPVLRRVVSTSLTDTLKKTLTCNPHWSRLIKSKKFAVGVVDIRDVKNPKVAWVNGNVMMYAASLPKIAVLLAAMQAIEDGELPEDDSLISDMELMIRNSDNAATTRTIDRIGLKKIESVVRSPQYKLFNPKVGGGLWVGKRYAKTGKRNPDPLMGLSHAATVSQVCRFYYMLATGRLVSVDKSRQMLDIMAYPHAHHKFVSFLDSKYAASRIFRKSGTWKVWHSDSVLLWSKDGKARYILVGLVEDSGGEAILRELVQLMDILLCK